MNVNQFFLRLIAVFLISGAAGALSAQPFLQYWGRPDALLQDQASLVFEQSHKILEKYPPTVQAGDERKLALYALDLLLHDTRLDNSPVVNTYMNRMACRVSDQLQKERPQGNETRFYRLYNHGFIVQTATVTIGIDLVRGGRKGAPVINDSIMRVIVNQCDTLLVSHTHSDHYDPTVVGMFEERQRKVAPPLQISAFPGHQDNMPNNLYVVTLPNGLTFMHTGDQDNPADLEMISGIGDSVRVDVLLAHCWMRPVDKVVAGVRPALVLCGHENELEHTIDHRESYWMTFHRMANMGTPFVVMAWGESFSYRLDGGLQQLVKNR